MEVQIDLEYRGPKLLGHGSNMPRQRREQMLEYTASKVRWRQMVSPMAGCRRQKRCDADTRGEITSSTGPAVPRDGPRRQAGYVGHARPMARQ